LPSRLTVAGQGRAKRVRLVAEGGAADGGIVEGPDVRIVLGGAVEITALILPSR